MSKAKIMTKKISLIWYLKFIYIKKNVIVFKASWIYYMLYYRLTTFKFVQTEKKHKDNL